MRASLPQLDGDLHVAGLSAPVTVLRDGHGVPHTEAATLTDMLVAQGYVTAQDRLWQMDMIRRASGGELSELLGAKTLEHDRMQRVLLFRRTAARLAGTLPAEQHAQLEAYARGVECLYRGQRSRGAHCRPSSSCWATSPSRGRLPTPCWWHSAWCRCSTSAGMTSYYASR